MGLLESIRDGSTASGRGICLKTRTSTLKPGHLGRVSRKDCARSEAVMQREMFTPPGGLTYIPREYVVYLSSEDDKDWQGDKRRGLEQGLFLCSRNARVN